MSEPRRFPFGGVPAYNPQSLSRDEAIAQFHARQAAYESLIDLLRREQPPHVLIIGTRGMGKTTLLQRVRYGVEDDADLNGRYLVLAFPEEQYNVTRLHHFLLNAVDAVADAMERVRNEPLLKRVEEFAEMVGKRGQEEIKERVPQFLVEIGLELRRNFLLLVDNADRLFETIDEREQWTLRELLANRHDLTLFGATTQASDGIYGPERAFYEFFQIHRLAPLTEEEVRTLLLRLSESVGENAGEKGSPKRRVEDWLATDAARLRTLVQLTGGNPRTTVLLFHLVLDGLDGGAREYLEQLLDQCTPTYKGRVDELPPQAQQVLDAVALRWDPVMAAEVAEYTGLETTAASAQLSRLVRQGILEKADPGDTKKALYQVAERFFNIWYLMRASRRVRAKLRWFVEFLRVFFEPVELEQMAWERFQRFGDAGRARPAEIETAFAYAVASGADRSRFEDYLRRECADTEPEWRPLLDLVPCLADNLERKSTGGAPATLTRTTAECLKELRGMLAKMPAAEIKPAQFEGTSLSFEKLRGTLENGWTTLQKMIALYPKTASVWNCLGNVLQRMPGRSYEAETAYRRATDLEPMSATYWADLGKLLSRMPEKLQEAEAALRKAIELDPKSAWYWDHLGEVLAKIPERRAEAEPAYRKAIDLDATHAEFWADLGLILTGNPGSREEAESVLRTAIELAPKAALYWAGLGLALRGSTERTEEAAAAFRKAIELNPMTAWYWALLGRLLGSVPKREDEAEAAFKKALELDLNSGDNWASFGVFLACRAAKPREAEVALRKSVELEPGSARNLRNLGVLLYCELLQEKEAVGHIRRAQQLRPADPMSAAVLAVCAGGSEVGNELLPVFVEAVHQAGFWDEALELCQNYAPFGKILLGICDLVQEQDGSNGFVRLHRAVALAQLGDFPRASVALDDALAGDPIELFSFGRKVLEVFFAAAVRRGRVRDCLELLDRKEWKDAWRPIYEALRAVEAGSGEYLKRVAVEIREPAAMILRQIAPELPDLPAQKNVRMRGESSLQDRDQQE